MPYEDTFGENAALLRRTITGFADFSGRSRRTEVIYYWIATALAGVVFEFIISTMMSARIAAALSTTFQVATMIPMFALLVRRLHDQDKSASWALLYPLALLLRVPLMVAALRGDINETITLQTSPAGLTSGFCIILTVILSLLGGTHGPNSYGPDPRAE